MTNLICELIHVFFRLVGFLVPEITIDPMVITNGRDVVSSIRDFILSVNFLVPLPDIFLIVTICITLRTSLFMTFVGNWILRRILDVIP